MKAVLRITYLIIFFACCMALQSRAQDYKAATDLQGMPVFYPPEEGVRGGFNPVGDNAVFNPQLFYARSKSLGKGFKSIKARRRYYQSVNDSIKEICRWFDAARIVTKRNSLGAADHFNFGLLNKHAARFMQQGNAYLFVFNRSVAMQLLDSGRINRLFVTANFKDSSRREVHIYKMQNRELDEALVLLEQTLVQYFIDIYRQQHPGLNMKKVFKGINKAMYLPFAPRAVRKTLKQRFTKKQPFQFQSFDDRVALGIGLIDYIYR